MPNIRSQEVTADRIHIVASDGREVTISRAKLAAEFAASKLATTDERKVAVADVIKKMIVAALGEEQISAEDLEFDFDPADAKRAPVLVTKDAGQRVARVDAIADPVDGVPIVKAVR